MSWIEIVPAVVACVVVLVAPGTLVARAAGAPTWLALGLGPGLTVAYLTVLATVLARAGVAWTPAAVGLVTAASVVAVVLVATALRRLRAVPRPATAVLSALDERGPGSPWSRRPLGAPALSPTPSAAGPAARSWAHPSTWVTPSAWTWRAWTAAALLVSSVLVLVPTVVGTGSPDAPLQQWDAVYHLNGLALVHETGDASQLNGLYGDGASVYYPTAWHAVVSLVVGAAGTLTASTVTAAANASTLVMSLVWLVGAAAFARAAFPRRPEVTVLAAVLVAAFSMFPTVQLSTLAQWPNGLSTTLIPGAAAGVLVCVRAWRSGEPGGRAGGLVVGALALGAAGGVALAQPSGFVGLVVVLLPFVLTVAWVAARDTWRAGRRTLVVAVLATLVVGGAAGVLVVARSSVLEMVLGFARAPQREIPVSVVRLLADQVLSPVPGNLVVSVLVVVGAVALVRRRQDRWLVVSAALVVVLAALAAGPDNPLRVLTGIWYTQAARIEAFYPVPASVLAAVGAVAVVDRLRSSERVRRAAVHRPWVGTPAGLTVLLLVVALVTSAGFQAPQRAVRYAEAYDPGRIEWGTMLSAEETALLRDLPDLVGEDAVVLGDPFNGSAYAWSVGQTHVVFPQLNLSGLDPARQYLLDHFDDVRTDPWVCRYAENLGVTHLYLDTAEPEDGAKPSPAPRALRDVDVSEGFVLVAQAGTASLYEVTACD